MRPTEAVHGAARIFILAAFSTARQAAWAARLPPTLAKRNSAAASPYWSRR